MDYSDCHVIENHLWMATSSPNIFYAASDDRIWLLTRDQLIDVYSKVVKPVTSINRVSTVFENLLFRFTAQPDGETDRRRSILHACPRFVFGKIPISKLHKFGGGALVKDRDYVTKSSRDDDDNDKNKNPRHGLYEQTKGHPKKLVLSVDRGKPVCDHKLTMLVLLAQETSRIRLRFFYYQETEEEEEEARNKCLKCKLINELWTRVKQQPNTKIYLDYAFTRFILFG